METNVAVNAPAGRGGLAKASAAREALSLSPAVENGSFEKDVAVGLFSGILSNIISTNYNDGVESGSFDDSKFDPAERGANVLKAVTTGAGAEATNESTDSRIQAAVPREAETRRADITLTRPAQREEVPAEPGSGPESVIGNRISVVDTTPENRQPETDNRTADPAEGRECRVGAPDSGALEEVRGDAESGAVEGVPVDPGPKDEAGLAAVAETEAPSPLEAGISALGAGLKPAAPGLVEGPDGARETGHPLAGPPIPNGGPTAGIGGAVTPDLAQVISEVPGTTELSGQAAGTVVASNSDAPKPVGNLQSVASQTVQMPNVVASNLENPIPNAPGAASPAPAVDTILPAVQGGTAVTDATSRSADSGLQGTPSGPAPGAEAKMNELPAPFQAEPKGDYEAPSFEVRAPQGAAARDERRFASLESPIVNRQSSIEKPPLSPALTSNAADTAPRADAGLTAPGAAEDGKAPVAKEVMNAVEFARRVAAEAHMPKNGVAVDLEPEVRTAETAKDIAKHPLQPVQNPLSLSASGKFAAVYQAQSAAGGPQAPIAGAAADPASAGVPVIDPGEDVGSALQSKGAVAGARSDGLGFLDRLSRATSFERAAEGARNSHSLAYSKSAEAVERVTKAIRMTLAANKKSVRIFLNPPHLGSMRITLKISDGVMTGKLETSTEAARAVLAGNVAQLKESLSEQGIKVQNFEINVSGHETRDPGENFEGADRQAMYDGADSEGGKRAKDADAPLPGETDADMQAFEASPRNAYSLSGGSIDLVA